MFFYYNIIHFFDNIKLTEYFDLLIGTNHKLLFIINTINVICIYNYFQNIVLYTNLIKKNIINMIYFF